MNDKTVINRPPIKVTAQRGILSKKPQSSTAAVSYTHLFKTDLDTVINALREDKGLLHNRYDMGAFARKYPESAMQGNYCTEYGFRVDTGKHAFLFRCNPTFQIATLLGTPRYKAGTPFHTAVKTVP